MASSPVRFAIGFVISVAGSVAIIGNWHHDKAVEAYKNDSLPAARHETVLMDARRAALEIRANGLIVLLDAQHAAVIAARDTLDALRTQFHHPMKLPLPDTGSVPVALVRAAQDAWMQALSEREKALQIALKLDRAQQAQIDSLTVLLAIRTDEYNNEHVLRLHWQNLAEHAPVETTSTKLFGFVPLPSPSVGVQAGLGFNGQPYFGVGVQLGYTIHFGGKKKS